MATAMATATATTETARARKHPARCARPIPTADAGVVVPHHDRRELIRALRDALNSISLASANVSQDPAGAAGWIELVTRQVTQARDLIASLEALEESGEA